MAGWASTVRQAVHRTGPSASARHEVCGWLVVVVGGASERSGGHFLYPSALSENRAAHRFQYGGNVPVQGGVRGSHGALSEHRHSFRRREMTKQQGAFCIV